MAQDAKHRWFDLATQYYVVARFSAFAGLLPVYGNLFHHAVEMYLKGCLSSKLTLSELKGLNHNLWKIWQRFKQEVADATLSRFDDAIRELHKFENLRYPDKIISQGMQVAFGIKKGDFSFASSPKGQPPRYGITVEEIDSLVEALFEKASVNPKAFTGSLLKSDARTYLKRDNAVAHKLADH